MNPATNGAHRIASYAVKARETVGRTSETETRVSLSRPMKCRSEKKHHGGRKGGRERKRENAHVVCVCVCVCLCMCVYVCANAFVYERVERKNGSYGR